MIHDSIHLHLATNAIASDSCLLPFAKSDKTVAKLAASVIDRVRSLLPAARPLERSGSDASKALKPWNDQVIPLSSPCHYNNRFETLKNDVARRFEKYFGEKEFALWNRDRSDLELEREFLELSQLRGAVWFDPTVPDIGRAWREDFRPAFDLIHRGIVRNPNCIAFDYNTLEYFNGSLVACNGMRFLAMEAPEDGNTKQFFYALHDTAAPMLVRLTPEIEKNTNRCANYWNGRLNGNQLNVPVNIITSTPIEYLATDQWEDGSPANVDLLLHLVQEARARYKPEKGPLAVHCSAGVGRTGSFIAACCMIEEIDAQIKAGISLDRLQFSIERLVASLSLQRYAMVSNKSQYINLHRLANRYIDSMQNK